MKKRAIMASGSYVCNWYNKIHRFWPFQIHRFWQIKIQCFHSLNLLYGILPYGGEGKDEKLENVF